MKDGTTVLETERLRLRTWADGDAALLERHCNTPAVMRWIGPLRTAAETAAGIARARALQAERGHGFWAIERKADGAFLGTCGLKIADEGFALAGELAIGWTLREDAWGQGYAREAALATLDFAFATLGAARVVALTVEQNAASWGLMERIGMRRRPDLAFDDPGFPPELMATIVYVIEQKEWRP